MQDLMVFLQENLIAISIGGCVTFALFMVSHACVKISLDKQTRVLIDQHEKARETMWETKPAPLEFPRSDFQLTVLYQKSVALMPFKLPINITPVQISAELANYGIKLPTRFFIIECQSPMIDCIGINRDQWDRRIESGELSVELHLDEKAKLAPKEKSTKHRWYKFLFNVYFDSINQERGHKLMCNSIRRGSDSGWESRSENIFERTHREYKKLPEECRAKLQLIATRLMGEAKTESVNHYTTDKIPWGMKSDNEIDHAIDVVVNELFYSDN